MEPPKLILAGGTRLSRSLEPGTPCHIGSARHAQLRIPHPSIAPVHCTVSWDEALVTLRDEGSEIGTRINGVPIARETDLNHGDIVTVGLFEIEFHWPDQAACQGLDPIPHGERAGATAGAAAPGEPPWAALAVGDLFLVSRGQRVAEVPVREGLVIGTASESDIVLGDATLDPRHAVIERDPAGGFLLIDTSQSGVEVNGRFIDRHRLVIGDLLKFGDVHFFTYDGYALRRVRDGSGAGLQAWGVRVVGRAGQMLLRDASFLAGPGQFVGILGPSGAGKTTLLKALIGLQKTEAGAITIDGKDVREIRDLSRYIGYVPQQEIVHLDLTVRQALTFNALLRLPKRTPRVEIDALIASLAARLGLAPHLEKRARVLSGGQLKRLSVCVELLLRPPLLFLDEPTSGLDPKSERDLMKQLQELSYTGCTVICTTHVMENVYLMNSIEVVMADQDESGRPTPGITIFRGRPRLAREHFGVRTLTGLYDLLQERDGPDYKPPAEWQKYYESRVGVSLLERPQGSSLTILPEQGFVERPAIRRRPSLPILLARQWQLLRADAKNLILLAGQPILIGTLVSLVATGTNSSPTRLFLAAIATLWLGCGNAAPEIVRELTIFRRERFVGLSVPGYLLSKFLFLGTIAALQALVLWGIVHVGGLEGSALWQAAGLIGAAGAATAIGLAISAWARSSLQAVLMVPVVIIPQILFAGFVFPVSDWKAATVPRVLSRAFPSFAAQRVIDTSLMWQKRYGQVAALGLETAYDNLCTSLEPVPAVLAPRANHDFPIDRAAILAPALGDDGAPLPQPWTQPLTVHWLGRADTQAPPPAPDEKIVRWQSARDRNATLPADDPDAVPAKEQPSLRYFNAPGEYAMRFHDSRPALTGLASLMAWLVGALAVAWALLRRRDAEN